MKNPKAKGNLQKKMVKERPKKSLKILDAIEKCEKNSDTSVKIKNENEKESKNKASYENLNDLLKAVKKESKLTSKKTEKPKKTDTVEHVKEKSIKKEITNEKEDKCTLDKENMIKSKKNKRKNLASDPVEMSVKKKVKKVGENQSQKSKDNKKVDQLHEVKAEVISKAIEDKSQKSKNNKEVKQLHKVKAKVMKGVVEDKSPKSKDNEEVKEVQEVKKKINKIKTENKEKKTKVKNAKNKTAEEAIGNLELNKMNVEKAVDVIFQLAQKEKQEKKSLLPFEGNSIFLQINCIKIPKVPRRKVRMLLPNVMMSSTDEVALFVPDLERGRRKDHEKTVEHWETILREKGVTNINAIIPMNQVKNEYNQYEMRRKLARLYDFFLVDGRIAGHMTHLLGKSFTRLSTPPVPIRLHRENLKEEIDKALKKTTLEIHGLGPCHTVKVATLSMPQKKVVKNVLAICEQLKEKYPGGFDNIRSILIKTKSSLGIPVYYSIKHKNEVPVPIVKPKRPKAFTVVEGELTTLESDVKVSVTPSGRVTVVPMDEEKETESLKTIEKKPIKSTEGKPVKQKKIKIKSEKQ
ncbi:ribosomal L1 domain-containing protein CG13096-like [Chelonus insularis]|uniref:ribosomal L1 domain-containing protein CG13096-like n=1 Tax=Chelonus insularis TaxID=460826 RepID=UPI0015885DE3|nr:ribosomal L1 domain-containing protein CG13096-like [Chelonus insularis]